MVKFSVWGILRSVFFISCIYGLITTADTWIRWKWGYYSIDSLPYIIILVFMQYVESYLWMSELDKRITILEKKEAGR